MAALTAGQWRYLTCRDLRHHWMILNQTAKGGIVTRQLECRECGTIRTTRWTTAGTIIGNTYTYPDGYVVKGTRITALDVRLQVIARIKAIPNTTKEAMKL